MKVKIVGECTIDELNKLIYLLPKQMVYTISQENVKDPSFDVREFFNHYYESTESFEDKVKSDDMYQLFCEVSVGDVHISRIAFIRKITKLHPFARQYRLKLSGKRVRGLCKLRCK